MTGKDETGLTQTERDEGAMYLLKRFPDGIPSPRQIEEQIIAHGFRGQESVRRQGATLLYSHLRRAWRALVDQEPFETLGARQNHLLIGASGSGKTFLIEILERIAGVPVIVEDLNQFSDVGYVGESVSAIMSRLYEKADKRRGISAMGIVLLDEIDKLGTSESDRNSGGLMRLGVQRSLLTLLGSAHYDFPATVQNWTRAERKTLPMHCTTFLLAGAFAGIERMNEKEEDHSGVGFQASLRPTTHEHFPLLDESLLENTDVFVRFGLIPELFGRINHVMRFQPLDRNTLGQILDDNILPAYRKQFEGERLRIEITKPARELLLGKALQRQTAARGLEAALSPAIEEAIFEYCGQNDQEVWRTVQIVKDGGHVRAVIEAEAR